MHVLDVVVLAAASALGEALGLSRSGHGQAARIWLDVPPTSAAALERVLVLGICAGMAAALVGQIRPMLVDGVRVVARPRLVRTSPPARDAAVVAVIAAASVAMQALLRPYVELWAETPAAIGLGLLATGALIASSDLAVGTRESPRWSGALAAGAAHGLGLLPGASSVATALAVLLWVGVKPVRAVELAFLATIVTLLADFARSMVLERSTGGVDASTAVLAIVVAFVAAAAATRALRALVGRRRLGLLALWVVPLGLALVAYARALPVGAL